MKRRDFLKGIGIIPAIPAIVKKILEGESDFDISACKVEPNQPPAWEKPEYFMAASCAFRPSLFYPPSSSSDIPGYLTGITTTIERDDDEP